MREQITNEQLNNKCILWSMRGFQITDLDDMDIRSMLEVITKPNIWKEPNYIELYRDGYLQEDLYYLYLVYNSIGKKIVPYNKDDLKIQVQKYVELVLDLKHTLFEKLKTKTLNYGADLREWALSRGIIQHTKAGKYVFTNEGVNNSAISLTFKRLLIKSLNTKKWLPYKCSADGDALTEQYTVQEIRTMLLQARQDEQVRIMLLNAAQQSAPICKEFYSTCYTTQIHIGKGITNVVRNPAITKTSVEKNTNVIITRTELQHNYVMRKAPRIRQGDAKITALSCNNQTKQACFGFKSCNIHTQDTIQQEYLNCIVDAFSDLAYVLNYPFHAISLGFLNNAYKLNLVVEPQECDMIYTAQMQELQLSGYKGAGTLAHAWCHALDNACRLWYSEENIGTQPMYMTELVEQGSVVQCNEGRQAVYNAFENVVNCMKYKYADKTAEYNKRSVYKRKIQHEIQKELLLYWDNIKYLYADKDEMVKDVILAYVNGKYADYNTFCQEWEQNLQIPAPEMCDETIIYYDLCVQQIRNEREINIELSEVVETEYYQSAKRIDTLCCDKTQYQSVNELFARAFESYVEDKLGAFVSEYLVHGTKSKTYKLINGADIYPSDAERIKINAAIGELLEIIRHEVIQDKFPVNLQKYYTCETTNTVCEKYFKQYGLFDELTKIIDAEQNLTQITRYNDVTGGTAETWYYESQNKPTKPGTTEYHNILNIHVLTVDKQKQVITAQAAGDKNNIQLSFIEIARLLQHKLVRITQGINLLPQDISIAYKT